MITNGDSRTDLMTSSESSLSFGKYRLTRLIARGGMGEVYLARLVGELGFEKRLVIKTILPHLAANPRFVELFAAEAKTAVALSHGNIVPIYELGRAGDTLYIEMGHVDGPSLSTVLDECRRRELAPDVGAALHIIRAVLHGLAYAHTSEPGRPAVVHRDITPRNVLLDRSGQVRIVDFGIAAPAHAEVEMRGGSTGYASPEQIRGDKVDPRADVFSAACLLYEMLTLERAFPKEGVWIMPDLADLPPELRQPLVDALALDPAARPADAEGFLHRLGPAFAKHGATWSDPQLASLLRSLFPDGWDTRTEPAVAGQAARGSDQRPVTQTFATRLTVVTKSIPAAAAAAPGAVATPTRSRWLPAIAIGLALGVATWMLTRRDLEPVPAAKEATALARTEPPKPPREPVAKPEPAEVPKPKPKPDPIPEPVPQPTTTIVALAVTPEDAIVTVDDTRVADVSKLEIPIAGATVVVRKTGYVPRTMVVDAEHPLPARIDLVAVKPAGDGFLEVHAPDVEWAEVRVDGRVAGQTPTRKISLPEGSHKVVVTCTEACSEKRVLLSRTVKIKAGVTATLKAE